MRAVLGGVFGRIAFGEGIEFYAGIALGAAIGVALGGAIGASLAERGR